MRYKFYNQETDKPLSTVLDTPFWGNSILGRLNKKTNGAVYVHKLTDRQLTAEYAWRIVGAEMQTEDNLTTYFKVYGVNGEYLPNAVFGVHWDKMTARISGGFEYPLKWGNHYYVPLENSLVTPESGGYTVQVLDLDYPSEGFSFGVYKQEGLHQCLVISFRLFPLGDRYPHDVDEIANGHNEYGALK